ncbi:YobA family protein [Amphibacillus sp. MSJ-3]|uniref:DUF3221 domain-containing protein n=1 Tax=Amphibacillus sp. MSJ-3 TaxID=2841505 RepID=UPI001C0F04B5|nr:DUF3221 domain-containing protein [Amphibacillus sp. MSJ-3]MBU5595000.1 YobA family protein [Amphibacillus sp. MSJ-3]
MKRLIQLIYIISLTISLISCSNQADRAPDITGYVVEKSEQNILVSSVIPEDLSGNGGVSEFYQMIWFSNAPKELNYGDKVDIWHKELHESYPARSTIEHYTICESDSPEGAKMTESEVLEQVLSQKDIQPSELYAVRSTYFNKNKQTWIITLVEIWTEEVVTIEYSETDHLQSNSSNYMNLTSS